jgi:hypothetical protein
MFHWRHEKETYVIAQRAHFASPTCGGVNPGEGCYGLEHGKNEVPTILRSFDKPFDELRAVLRIEPWAAYLV